MRQRVVSAVRKDLSGLLPALNPGGEQLHDLLGLGGRKIGEESTDPELFDRWAVDQLAQHVVDGGLSELVPAEGVRALEELEHFVGNLGRVLESNTQNQV